MASHRDQHTPGPARQADHGHAQLRLADRHRRCPHAWRPRIRSTASPRRWAICGWTVRSLSRASTSARASATLHVLTSYGVAQDIELRTNDDGIVDRFSVELRTAGDQDMARHRHRADQVGRAVLVSGLEGHRTAGEVRNSRGHQHRLSLPLASIFKLYVLLAVADAVKAGTVDWNDQLTITEEAKAVGSAGLEELPPGAQVSVRKAAQEMISASDNMATDLLIARLGPRCRRACAGDGRAPRPGQHDAVSDHA